MISLILINQESGGGGQEALYRISKAYSVYDSEIGYCQGQSFLIAALLLQMPEEQAFGVLVEIMFAYGLRDLYRLLSSSCKFQFQTQSYFQDPQSQFQIEKCSLFFHGLANNFRKVKVNVVFQGKF